LRERPSLGYLADHCGRKPGSTSGSPFGEEHRVFKVCGEIFAVLHVEESPVKITFKADPELTGLLRGQYPSIQPARYFDKRYWSTLACDGTVPDDEVVELLDASYDIVFEGLRKSDREALKGGL
jgi:predicted DNA-binding protein (MmcQ/YjbR family)